MCSCKLLSRTQMILFLNKCDLLQAKLMRGVRIRDQVPSYSDRKNDLPTATRCMWFFVDLGGGWLIGVQIFNSISRRF